MALEKLLSLNDEFISIVSGDSFKNAGIVGLVRLLEFSKAKFNEDYKYLDNILQVKKSFFLNNNLPELYVRAVNERFKRDTKYYKVSNNLKKYLLEFDFLEEDELKSRTKEIIDDLRYSDDKNRNIYNAIKVLEYDYKIDVSPFKNIVFKKNEILTKLDVRELLDFLKIEKVEEVFMFKEISRRDLSKLISPISFLNINANNKDYIPYLNKDFVEPLAEDIFNDFKSKGKRTCINCGTTVNPKVKNKINMISEMVNDLARKTSPFYNFECDFDICSLCSFIYLLIPLGMVKYGFDYVFINHNDSIESLIDLNNPNLAISIYDYKSSYKGKFLILLRLMNLDLDELKALNRVRNVEVLSRTRISDTDTYRYEFDILNENIVKRLTNNNVKKYLEYLSSYREFEEVSKLVLAGYYLEKPLEKALKSYVLDKRKGNSLVNYLYYLDVELRGEMMNNEDLNVFRYYGRQLRNHVYIKDNSFDRIINRSYSILNAIKAKDNEKVLGYLTTLCINYDALPARLIEILDEEKGLAYARAFVVGLYSKPKESKGEKEDE